MIDLCSDSSENEDEKLARKLQKEFDNEPGSVEQFECPICLEDKPIDSKFIYEGCEHTQCRDCASDFFLRQIELKNKINCVLCQKEVSILDLELVLPTDSVSKYLKTHNIEEKRYEDENNAVNEPPQVPSFLTAHRHPTKAQKSVKRPTPRMPAPVKPKKVPKNIHQPVRPKIDEPVIRHRHSFLDDEYIPGNDESGRKNIKSPHTRDDTETSTDADSEYEYPIPKRKIRRVDSTPLLKRIAEG